MDSLNLFDKDSNPSSYPQDDLIIKISLSRINIFYDFLQTNGLMAITNFRSIGIHNDIVKKIIRLINFIHSKPPVKVTRIRNRTYIEIDSKERPSR